MPFPRSQQNIFMKPRIEGERRLSASATDIWCLVNRGPSRLDRATKVRHQMVAVKKNLEALAGFTKPCGASGGFSSTAAVFSIMLKSSNWPQRYLTLRICSGSMQAKYSELWQILGREVRISDPSRLDSRGPNKYCSAVRIIHREFITGK